MKEFMPLILISYTIHGCREMDVQVINKQESKFTGWKLKFMIWATEIKLYIYWRNIKLYTVC